MVGWGCHEHSAVADPYNGLDGFKPYRYKEIVDGSVPGPAAVVHGEGLARPDIHPQRHRRPLPRSPTGSTLADEPHNAGLRAHRVNPEHVQPGDSVWARPSRQPASSPPSART